LRPWPGALSEDFESFSATGVSADSKTFLVFSVVRGFGTIPASVCRMVPTAAYSTLGTRQAGATSRDRLPVKWGKSDGLLVVFGDKLVHGVSALFGSMVVEHQYPTRVEAPSLFGCGYAAIAVLKISARTVRRDWDFAKSWLMRELSR
jgi:hypothetical protein